MKILVIDDSNSIALMVGQMIKELGHEFYHAVDGQDAVDVIGQGSIFDVILLDWNMPNMDGYEFLQYNQEHKITDAAILMMTTENKPEKIMKALEAGALEFIMKTFDKQILEMKIKPFEKKAA